ncbi:hypothetical protein FS827_22530 [Agrobacterium vitis]|uniref:Uncharacterized protein n=1 Tax=Agrobacterium vitis TaxID=373 RepID=A0A7K1RM01_AGRVI|nr:hypothetical protein [Agrobacterium vitis]MCF1464084.1 hypothetical protein [Allorhizobium ampelinum]MVA59073.1 hypothetical protein [Agrobacterium vitis]
MSTLTRDRLVFWEGWSPNHRQSGARRMLFQALENSGLIIRRVALDVRAVVGRRWKAKTRAVPVELPDELLSAVA